MEAAVMNMNEEETRMRGIDSQLEHLEKTVADNEEALAQSSRELVRAQEAQEILQSLAQAVQQKAHQRIAEVVSSCLSAVFDDPYEFHIEFERKRGKTEARLRFKRWGLDVDPMSSTGGGVVDVAAFALRVACLVMHRPRLRPFLALDEPFRFVSAQYRDNVRKMLESLSKDMGIQIVMVTHIEELATGQIVRL